MFDEGREWEGQELLGITPTAAARGSPDFSLKMFCLCWLYPMSAGNIIRYNYWAGSSSGKLRNWVSTVRVLFPAPLPGV